MSDEYAVDAELITDAEILAESADDRDEDGTAVPDYDDGNDYPNPEDNPPVEGETNGD